MIIQFCPYCQQALEKKGNKYICPVHGIVLQEVESEKKEDPPGYIG